MAQSNRENLLSNQANSAQELLTAHALKEGVDLTFFLEKMRLFLEERQFVLNDWVEYERNWYSPLNKEMLEIVSILQTEVIQNFDTRKAQQSGEFQAACTRFFEKVESFTHEVDKRKSLSQKKALAGIVGAFIAAAIAITLVLLFVSTFAIPLCLAIAGLGIMVLGIAWDRYIPDIHAMQRMHPFVMESNFAVGVLKDSFDNAFFKPSNKVSDILSKQKALCELNALETDMQPESATIPSSRA